MVKFSIIIPTYNSAWCIKRCIDSVISQTYGNWEIIIINNFSTDDTEKIVSSYNDERIKIINNANNGIIANSRNKGIKISKGEWICFLDSDDWWISTKLEDCLPFTLDYDMIYHDLYLHKNNKLTLRKKKKFHFKEISIDDILLNENPIANSSVLVRKEVLDSVGLLSENPRLVTVEDLDYWIRVFKLTRKIKYIDKPLGYYWIGNNTSSNIKHALAERALYAKYISELESSKRNIAKSFLSYKMARVFHQNSKFKEAIYYYSGAFHCGHNFKTFILLLLALIHLKK